MTMTKRLIGNVTDIDRKGSRVFKVNDMEIALFRLTDDTVLAIENKCPHKAGALSEGMVCGTKVHCPLHDWRIDLHSGVVQEPDKGCVATFTVEVDPVNGSVYVTV